MVVQVISAWVALGRACALTPGLGQPSKRPNSVPGMSRPQGAEGWSPGLGRKLAGGLEQSTPRGGAPCVQ